MAITMSSAEELARCDEEIRLAEEYRGENELGALMGWADWMIERQFLEEHRGDLLQSSAPCEDGNRTGTNSAD